MINYEINVPFGIGDTVWIKDEKFKRITLPCPFCHGNPEYNTGYNTVKFVKMQYLVTPWVLKCGTCSGTGEVSTTTGKIVTWREAVVKGVHQIHGWMQDTVYDITYKDDGTDGTATGREIYMDKPQMSEA